MKALIFWLALFLLPFVSFVLVFFTPPYSPLTGFPSIILSIVGITLGLIGLFQKKRKALLIPGIALNVFILLFTFVARSLPPPSPPIPSAKFRQSFETAQIKDTFSNIAIRTDVNEVDLGDGDGFSHIDIRILEVQENPQHRKLAFLLSYTCGALSIIPADSQLTKIAVFIRPGVVENSDPWEFIATQKSCKEYFTAGLDNTSSDLVLEYWKPTIGVPKEIKDLFSNTNTLDWDW